MEKFSALKIVNRSWRREVKDKNIESLKETFCNNRFSHKVLIYLHE